MVSYFTLGQQFAWKRENVETDSSLKGDIEKMKIIFENFGIWHLNWENCYLAVKMCLNWISQC